jgi:uncharacterized membrane protein HdeD (DUF308 family)
MSSLLTDEVSAAYRRTKWALALRGLLGIALGIVIVARPMASLAAFALVIAIWALFDGLTNLVRAFEVRRFVPHWWVVLIAGAIGVIFGLAALYAYPGLSLGFAVVWAALWLLTAGGLAISVAMMERRANVSWGWTMTLGVVTVIAGILALVFPGLTLAGLLSLIAAFGFVSGVVMLATVAKLQRFEHDLKHAGAAGGH